MEAFPVGSHVVIELADERKIAGYLAGGSIEEGVILRVTHKDSELVRRVSESMKADIARQLSEKNVWWLRGAMALRGHFTGVFAGRDQMEAQIAWDTEQGILDSVEDGMQFRELSAPVTTYVHPGAIMLMEATDDKLMEAEVSLFDQTLGETLEKILTVGEGEETTKDENETETEGIQGSTGRGASEGTGTGPANEGEGA